MMHSWWIWAGVGPMVFGLIGTVTILLGFLYRRLKDRTKELDELKGQVLEWNRRLEEKVAERTRALEATHARLQEIYLETVKALMEAVSAKDSYLLHHSDNVALYAEGIAAELALTPERMDRLLLGCQLHDLGKIAVPDSILLKPGPLTTEEFDVMKRHPAWGARILQPLAFMKDVTEMVHQEHERWDGKGYPLGLKGEQIRLEARIIAVADSLDAMTSDRPYRRAMPLEYACQELEKGASSQFDPQVAQICVRLLREGRLKIASHPHLDENHDRRADRVEQAYQRVKDKDASKT